MTTLKRELTDRALMALKPAPKGKRYIRPDAKVKGFGCRVTDSGHRSFVLVTRYPGAASPAPRAIGDYPGMGLAEAREIAEQWRKDVKDGIDPREKAEAEREAARNAAEAAERAEQQAAENTFAKAWAAYIEERKGDSNGRNRTLDVVDGVIKKHVIHKLGDRPLTAITRVETNDILRKIATTGPQSHGRKGVRKGTPTHARRIASYLRTFGEWAEEDGRIEEAKSPFAKLKKFGTENKRKRVVTEDEIRAVWKASTEMGAFGRAVRLMLATGQRRTEVGDLPWREIDLDKKLWTLPAARAKADRDHLVPLSPLALSILSECPRFGLHVFTTRSTPKGDTIPISGWSKSKAKLDALAVAALRKQTGDAEATIPAWILHDLRRTCSTMMTGKCKVSRLVVGKVLNHAEQGVTGQHYDLHDYLPEKRQALDLWGARLAAIIEGREGPDNVVSLEAARGQR